MALQRCALASLLLHLAAAQDYPFCLDGIAIPEFSSNEKVDIIYAQAPLFSTNKKIGNKFALLNLFHSSLVFAQGKGSERQYWTLEFDFTGGNLLRGIVPNIVEHNGSPYTASLHWESNNARYCLTTGLLWGEEHWSKRFEVLMSVHPDQLRHTFTDFLTPLNSTSDDIRPQYQLWRVTRFGLLGGPREILVRDVTCQDGAVWFLHHLTSALKVTNEVDWKLRATAVYIHARRVVPVDVSNPEEWKRVVNFYKKLGHMLGKNTIFSRLLDVAEIIFRRKYVYDTNSGIYYEVLGNYLPWMTFGYPEYPIEGPPWNKTLLPPAPSSAEGGVPIVV
jgi:hypothetical protein